MAGNFAAAFFFPLPDPGDELIAREISALLTLGVHLPLNHHLRGDARMISANHPQRILAAQPFITDHDILKCIVKRMADMERSGHVGWRIDNSEGLRVGAFRTEQSLAFPMRIPRSEEARVGKECGMNG